MKRRVKKWQDDNADRFREYQRAYRRRPDVKLRERDSYLRRKYGITLEEYDALLAKQGGVCAICGRAPRDDISLHVDHDHATGKVRGLLCFRCNNAVGDLEDDPNILRRAAVYVDVIDSKTEARIRERVAALVTAR